MKSQFKTPSYQGKVQTRGRNNSLARKINFIIVHFLAHA